MHPTLRAACALGLCLLAALPARAQWQVQAGPGLRQVVHAEYDLAGRRLVRESGALPGLALQVSRTAGALTWFGGADWYQGSIAYAGRTQAGTAASSSTSTTLASLRTGAAYAFANGFALLAALESERWRRDIAGTASSTGLQERYRSTRLLVGTSRRWQVTPGRLEAEASLLRSGPERMAVGFSGRFDPVSFDGARARGARLGIALRPAPAPWLELRTRADWTTVPRSADAALTVAGEYRGAVVQPEHTRLAFTFAVAATY